MLVACAALAAVPLGASGRVPKITAVRAKADAHVTVAASEANFGRVRRLAVDSRPLSRLYVRFDIDARAQGAQRINLMLYSHSGSRLGVRVRLVPSSWNERGINFENAPRIPRRFISSGPLVAGAWKAIDVTSLAANLGADQVSFAVTTPSTRALYFASRESGLRAPRLVIQEREGNSGPPPPPPPPPGTR